MKIQQKLLITGIVMLVASQSCTKLDPQVYDQIQTKNFYKTPDEFLGSLGAPYTNLYQWMTNNTMFTLQEITTDEIVVPVRSDGGWNDGGIWARLHTHTNVATDDRVNNVWNMLFSGIGTCNRLIATYQQSTSPVAKTFISEVAVLRAFYYWEALDIFGNIPVETRFADANPQPPTVPRAQVYAFIETELLNNVNNLSKANDVTTYGRVNYYVGEMILAKLYLNAQVYTGTPAWDKASAVLDNIINSGVYGLEPNFFASLMPTVGPGEKENIFVIPYDAKNAQGFWMAQASLNAQSGPTFNSNISPWNGFASTQDFYQSFTDPVNNPGPQGPIVSVDGVAAPGVGTQDVRLKSFLAGPQYAKDGVTPILDPGDAGDPDGPQLVYTPKINSFTNALREAGVRVAKWPYEDGVQLNMDNDFAIFRYSDVLLMKAEALWRQNPGDLAALALVNQVRARAGVAAFASLTAANLLAERGRELFAEGHRRTDLIRFGMYTQPFDFKPGVDPATVTLFPIPYAQLGANPHLTQNPGY